MCPENGRSVVYARNKRKLKEKNYQHQSSGAHKTAVDIVNVRKKKTLETCIHDANSHMFAETVRIFRTAYAVAKMNMPFTCQKTLVQLQELNGLDMGRVHRSDHSCASILKDMAVGMKKNLCLQIKNFDSSRCPYVR